MNSTDLMRNVSILQGDRFVWIHTMWIKSKQVSMVIARQITILYRMAKPLEYETH